MARPLRHPLLTNLSNLTRPCPHRSTSFYRALSQYSNPLNPRIRKISSNDSTTALPLPTPTLPSPTEVSPLRANPTRLWNSIHHTAQWGAANSYGAEDTETGLSRLALSATDKLARDWFVSETEALGCEITVDRVGNIFAVRPGAHTRGLWRPGIWNGDEQAGGRLPATFAGSHLDSQPSGGRYDGVLGVCAGLEMLRVIDEQRIEHYGDIGVVNWTNEEGARWGVSMMGSGVWAGARGLEEVWALRDQMEGAGRGRTVREELEAIGYLGERGVGREEGFKMAAHFEVHIEQARGLEVAEKRVGVVKGVQGYVWLEVVMQGKESHAGTTAWEDRVDALSAAAWLIMGVAPMAQKHGGLATVGCIEAQPGSINTIPGEVKFTIDLRHKDNDKLAKMVANVKGSLDRLQSTTDGLSCKIKTLFESKAIDFTPIAMSCVKEAAQAVTGEAEIPYLVSGAGHDSVHASKHCPTAMIFVPCKGGLSHHPKEYASPEACADGASVLLQSVLRFDRQRYETDQRWFWQKVD